MYCTKCGKMIDDDVKFCASCGTPVTGTIREPDAVTVETEPVHEEMPAQSLKQSESVTVDEATTSAASEEAAMLMTEEAASEIHQQEPDSSAEGGSVQNAAVVLSPELINLKNRVEETGKRAFVLFKNLSPKKRRLLLLVPIIILAVVVIVSFSDGGVSDDDYISCAKTAVSKQLKSPGSAFYSNEKVVEKDDYGRVLVVLTVDSQNGFGAYLRSHYVVVIESYDSKTEEFTYSRNGIQHWTDDMDFLEEILIQSAKDASDWNEPIEKE